MLLRSNFSSFPHYFIYTFLTLGVKLHIHLLDVVVQFIVSVTLSTLLCRGTDISKYFSESLGIRDNESRLYIIGYYKLYRRTCTAKVLISLCSSLAEQEHRCTNTPRRYIFTWDWQFCTNAKILHFPKYWDPLTPYYTCPFFLK